jgi:hypothetical protein
MRLGGSEQGNPELAEVSGRVEHFSDWGVNSGKWPGAVRYLGSEFPATSGETVV